MNNADKPVTELTKRELFAAMAMQGMLSTANGWETNSPAIADIAINSADALLAELEKARGE